MTEEELIEDVKYWKARANELRGALAEIERLRLATDEGSLAKRADRMWEISRQFQGRPVAGARPFLGQR